MSVQNRILNILLAAMLLLGQAGGWLHELSHYDGSRPPGSAAFLTGDPADRGDRGHSSAVADQQCLICLAFAAMALPTAVLVVALLAGVFGIHRRTFGCQVRLRWRTPSARGPPLFS